MKDWKLKWHKATEELPEKSGNYLVCRVNADRIPFCIQAVPYSKNHLLFNAFDYSIPPKAQKYAFDISNLYWAEYPKTIEE